MKYITLIIGLLVVGCLTPEQKALRGSVVGEYESPIGGWTRGNVTYPPAKQVYLENGTVEQSMDGKKHTAFKWAIVDGEIHAEDDDIYVYRLNDDSSITYIAIIRIRDGKRDDSIKFANITFKKIK